MATSRRPGNGAQLKVDNLPQLWADIRALVNAEVLVGVPEEATERPESPDDEGKEITNAALAYIHDNGAPEANIPARPFMIPGIEDGQERITNQLTLTARSVLLRKQGTPADIIQRRLTAVGLTAVSAIQRRIRQGIPPPLADYTLRQRAARGRKGAQQELDNRNAGQEPSMSLATPLMDTNEMLKSISFVIRDRKRRKR